MNIALYAPPSTLLITCGAMAREVLDMVEGNAWSHMTVECLPAKLHATPQAIPDRLRAKIRAARNRYRRIVVLYSDCGTGGEIDRIVAEEGVEAIGGAHCYEMFSGSKAYAADFDADPFGFYLTDFLARHFDRLVWQSLGLDRFPHLRDMYFGNYRKLVYLAQTEDAALTDKAREAAARLGLDFERRFTGYGDYRDYLGGL